MSPMAAYWEPNINDRIRLVLTYEKRVRPILWFQVKRDGSIYFGIRRNNPPVMKKGSKVVRALLLDSTILKERLWTVSGPGITRESIISRVRRSPFG
jgi:hypothetical protein